MAEDWADTLTRGIHVIDVHLYLKVADLFRFRWDPAILGVLAERPYRFRELLKRIEKHADSHVDDNALTRGLDRLKRAQHVQKTKMQVGRREVPLYAITDEGRRRLRLYGDFIGIYQRLNLPDDRTGYPGSTAPRQPAQSPTGCTSTADSSGQGGLQGRNNSGGWHGGGT